MANFDMQLGEVRVTRVEESVSPFLDPKMWFGTDYDRAAFDAEMDRLGPGFFDTASQNIVASVHSWVVRADGQTILIDTCFGHHRERLQWEGIDINVQPYLDRLAEAGVDRDEVDMVLCTHLHADHVGWNTRLDNGRWVPTFSKARYLMSRIEHDWLAGEARAPDALAMNVDTYNESVLPIVEAGRHQFVDGSEALAKGVSLHSLPGHTPGQTGLALDSSGARALFTGDALHFPLQIPLWHWPVIFDHDPAQGCETRRHILEHCVEHDALLLPAHFPDPFGCRIRHRGDRFEADFAIG